MIYLDYAAATPLDPQVMAAMQPYFTDIFYNPSALYSAAQAVAGDIEAARRQVAAVLGARSAEITFTAGGTEANNLAIHGIMQAFPEAELVISSIEHDSVRQPAQRYGQRLVEVPVATDGLLDIAQLGKAVSDRTVLISIMYANNEIGVVEPLRVVTKLVQDIRRDRQRRKVALPLYVHSDAAQAANYLDMHIARLGVDLMTINGGKLYGPKQSGALYVRGGIKLCPLLQGGGQEHGQRSGTENVAAIVGLATALQLAAELRSDEVRRLQKLQQLCIRLLKQDIPQAVINGSLKQRLPNNIHITIPGTDNERVLFELDAADIMAAAGSACSASHETASHVLQAIGLHDAAARASLRLTLGRQTSETGIRQAVTTLARIVAGTA